MRTRSTAPAAQPAPESEPEQLPPPPPTAERPSKTFILPSAATDDARLVRLPNPRTGELTRYFFCPKLGIHEFTAVAAPSHAPRSILFSHKPENSTGGKDNGAPASGSISKAAQLLVATPVDAMFFMIPILSPPGTSKGLFQPLDDILDSQDELPKHMRHVLFNQTFESTLQARAEAVCDSVEAGDQKMFRFNETKLLGELIAKAERMAAQGLPKSLEERFVRQALATPLMAVKRENPTTKEASSENKENEGEEDSEAKETPSTTTNSNSVSDGSTPATEPLPEEPTTSANVTHLLRISTALAFMKESYLSTAICARIDELLASPDSPIDFKPLNDHLKHIADLRAEALASRSLGDFSRKRNAEDDDAAEVRAEKKRRKEEEEKKKKAGESRGVKDLKKVNTTGMKKMSDFFTKAAPKKKS
ncbi:hypothetical protein P170DRAFT_434716 [Aspergillus steynii IBT 23096]|uniref:Ribonuclease H2 subunit B n=1 Tax=Aspergillus steynii IBT 23096 TaxID=1392250 RepID=A0A2I2GJE4_9EURO|nr:uncharacterized protein P170DRAFT_434716 [Aspergillus steynii IBT 23096]PLB52995.1 hypothetical protein P170DRAFT_434716 [Aspergillus steynii IBT 23096]